MRLRTFSSIGGLRIFGNPLSFADRGFNSMNDVLELKVDRRDLNDLALGMLKEIQMDASPELIAWVRQMVDAYDKALPEDSVLSPEQIQFVRNCENNAGESRKDGETVASYFERLRNDYGTDYIAIPGRSRVPPPQNK